MSIAYKVNPNNRAMKKIGILLIFFLLNTCVTYAQQIEVHKVFGRYKYRQYDKPLGTGKMIQVMQDEPEALRLVKSARKIEWVNTLFLVAGGTLVGDVIYNVGSGDALNLETLGRHRVTSHWFLVRCSRRSQEEKGRNYFQQGAKLL